MKTIVAFPLLAIALAACQPYNYGAGQQPYPSDQQGYPPYPDTGYPQGYPPGPPMPPGGPIYPGPGQPVGEATYRAIGTEPFWDLEIGRELVFTDRGNNVSVRQAAPAPITTATTTAYRTQRLEVNITRQQCSDGMSDRSYPDTVWLSVDGQIYRGCGAPSAFFSQYDETGQQRFPAPPPPSDYGQPYPPPQGYGQPYPSPPQGYGQPAYPVPGTPQGMPVVNLSSTNWRVLSINGTRTPASNFYVNFMPDQLGAKFGCNSMSGRYTQSGSILSVGPIAATRMACADMAFETQGSAILSRPLTISGFGNRITLSSDRGSIELVRAR